MTLDELVGVFRKHLWLPDPTPLLVVLATVVANHLPGDPVWLLLIGPPSSGKSEHLATLKRLPNMHEVSTFTRAGLLTASISNSAGATGGLLAEIGDFGIIVHKDFGSVLSENPSTRAEMLAALREIYDGSWCRKVGNLGGRTLAWNGKAGLIGAATESIDRHVNAIGAMGERFIFCRMPTLDDEGRLAQARAALNGLDTRGRQELADAVHTLITPLLRLQHTPAMESPVDREWLAHLADLATRCRSVVERDPRDRDVELVPQPEATPRLAKVLAQLARGLHHIGVPERDLYPTLATVALDGLPKSRRVVIETILTTRPGGELTAAEIGDRRGLPTGPVARTLEDLAAHHIVTRISVPHHPHRWGPADWLRERWAEVDRYDLEPADRGPTDQEPF